MQVDREMLQVIQLNNAVLGRTNEREGHGVNCPVRVKVERERERGEEHWANKGENTNERTKERRRRRKKLC